MPSFPSLLAMGSSIHPRLSPETSETGLGLPSLQGTDCEHLNLVTHFNLWTPLLWRRSGGFYEFFRKFWQVKDRFLRAETQHNSPDFVEGTAVYTIFICPSISAALQHPAFLVVISQGVECLGHLTAFASQLLNALQQIVFIKKIIYFFYYFRTQQSMDISCNCQSVPEEFAGQTSVEVNSNKTNKSFKRFLPTGLSFRIHFTGW